jgi:ATP-dependent Clp protease protease subunit
MRKTIIYIAIIIAILVGLTIYTNLAYANPLDHTPEKPTPPRELKQQCPITLRTKNCSNCHTEPSHKLKESFPDEGYKYPNYNTQIIFDDPKYGYYYLTTVDAGNLKDALDYFRKHKLTHVVIEINTFGGSIPGAWRSIGVIKRWQAEGRTVETRCLGFALSAGFLVFLAGDERVCSENSEFMWHELQMVEWIKVTSPAEKEKELKVLKHLQRNATEYIASRCNLTKERIEREVYDEELWLTGKEAMAWGVATKFLD